MADTRKLSKFENKVVSRIEGDSDHAVAERNARTAKSTAEGQVAALKGKLVDDEHNLTEAEEAYENIVYQTNKITDRKYYWQTIVESKSRLDSRHQVLQNTKDSIKFAQDFIKDNF